MKPSHYLMASEGKIVIQNRIIKLIKPLIHTLQLLPTYSLRESCQPLLPKRDSKSLHQV